MATSCIISFYSAIRSNYNDGYSGLCAIFVPSDRVSRKAVQDGAGQTCNDKKQPYDGRRKNHILDGRRQQDLQQSEKSP